MREDGWGAGPMRRGPADTKLPLDLAPVEAADLFLIFHSIKWTKMDYKMVTILRK